MILYSNNCPKCKILKEKLDNLNIEYDVCDNLDLMIEKGFMSIPMLEIDNKTYTYLEAINYLKENF